MRKTTIGIIAGISITLLFGYGYYSSEPNPIYFSGIYCGLILAGACGLIRVAQG